MELDRGCCAGLSAVRGAPGFLCLYMDVYICVALACFQRGGGRERQKRENNYTRVSHLKAYFSTFFFFF